LASNLLALNRRFKLLFFISILLFGTLSSYMVGECRPAATSYLRSMPEFLEPVLSPKLIGLDRDSVINFYREALQGGEKYSLILLQVLYTCHVNKSLTLLVLFLVFTTLIHTIYFRMMSNAVQILSMYSHRDIYILFSRDLILITTVVFMPIYVSYYIGYRFLYTTETLFLSILSMALFIFFISYLNLVLYGVTVSHLSPLVSSTILISSMGFPEISNVIYKPFGYITLPFLPSIYEYGEIFLYIGKVLILVLVSYRVLARGGYRL